MGTTDTNTHQSTHYALNEAQRMYDSEIDFVVAGLWDGGVDWYLGNAPSVAGQVDAARASGQHGNAATIEEALVDMANAARLAYPQSDYTRGRPTDITLHTTPHPEDLSNELATLVGDFELAFDASERGNSGALPWTLSFTAHGEPRHFGGGDIIELLTWGIGFANGALDSNGRPVS